MFEMPDKQKVFKLCFVLLLMEFDENLSAIHAYLCADGYVIKNPKTQKQKYYYIGFRNTNLVLLKDFQKRFYNYFKFNPRLRINERCVVQNKQLYEKLINKFNSFYSIEWKMPTLNNRLLKVWLRAFFDCEGWVFCKTHQNRHIGLDTINEPGINQIISALNKIGIKTIKKVNKKRKIFRIFIYGKENLRIFQEKIGFLHPDKKNKLQEVLKDYVVYEWNFPKNKKECEKFINIILEKRAKTKNKKHIRIISKIGENLERLKDLLKDFYDIDSLVYERTNGLGTRYYELNVNKFKDVQKLIDIKVIPNIFKLKRDNIICTKKN